MQIGLLLFFLFFFLMLRHLQLRFLLTVEELAHQRRIKGEQNNTSYNPDGHLLKKVNKRNQMNKMHSLTLPRSKVTPSAVVGSPGETRTRTLTAN